jgi:hypothetical protein
MNPKQVAEYAEQDSLALSEVRWEDIQDELRIRGTESGKLTRKELITNLQCLTAELQEAYRLSLE